MMHTHKTLPILLSLFGISTLLVLGACGQVLTPAAPVGTPVVMTHIVTRVVVQDVTQQVTKIVEVPVTVTPGPAAAPTSTPNPAAPSQPGLPLATLPQYTDCLYGPADWFVYKSSFPSGGQVEVVGQNSSGDWLAVEDVGGWNSCWIKADQAQLQAARVEDLPIVTTMLPRSEYEFGSPQIINTKRAGDTVTLSWDAIYMSRDEIRGYVIEAAICQGGQHVLQDIFVPKTFDENVGVLAVVFIDEAGCSEPSTAHIVTMGKRGFAEWEKIFWPPHP